MPGFLTDAELKDSVAAVLGKDSAELVDRWDQIISDANSSAYKDIRGAILTRGFTAAQADTWDRGPEFQRDLGTFWALTRGGGLHSYDDRFINKLDRRKDLETVPIESASGTVVQSVGNPQTQVGYGVLDTEDDDFTKEDRW